MDWKFIGIIIHAVILIGVYIYLFRKVHQSEKGEKR